MARRKVTYPPAKTATSGGFRSARADARAAAAAARVAIINPSALTGRADIRAGMRVEITSGFYAGEIATVESLVGGVIPAAQVRDSSGRARRVKTADLRPLPEAQTEGGDTAPE